MTIKIVKAKDFKPENVRFSTPKANKHGGKVVYVNYDYEDGSSPKTLRIQMPRMKAPFGVSGWDGKDKKDNSPSETSNDTLELSFNDEDKDLIEKFERLDDLAIEAGALNSKEFFKKKFDKEALKLFYKQTIKHNEDEEGERDNKYPPRLKTKLSKDKDYRYTAQIFTPEKERVLMDIHNYAEVIPKGSECVTIIECSGIWIINEKFGLSWRPAQTKVYISDNKLSGYSFIDDDEDAEGDNITDSSILDEEFLLQAKNVSLNSSNDNGGLSGEQEEETHRDLLDEDPIQDFVEQTQKRSSRRLRKE
jgi:hypothetical protein